LREKRQPASGVVQRLAGPASRRLAPLPAVVALRRRAGRALRWPSSKASSSWAEFARAGRSDGAPPRQSASTLRVIFAGLAGLAPLQAERTAAKGGPIGEQTLADPLTFYDTSSYGPRAVRAMATAVGIGQLVHGTDYPVHAQDQDPVEQAFGEGFAQLVKTSSPNRALGYTWVPATKTA
jgi:6-methylsalicylate decarboxylase